jgi:hypothetical protein
MEFPLVYHIALLTKKEMTSKKQFRLIVDSNTEDVDLILDYAKNNFLSDFIIITNNQFLKNEFDKKTDHCKTVLDLVPTDSKQEIMAYQNGYEGSQFLVANSSEIKYKKISTISMLKNRIMDELIFLEKIHFILNSNNNNNVILCLSPWNYYYFACSDIAEALGFAIMPPLSIKEKELTIVVPHRIVEHTKILKTIYGKESLTNLIYNQNDKAEISNILKQPEFSVGKNPTLFFLTTNNFDLYLKPVYPIIREFNEHNFPYLIFTTDTRAKQFLTEKKIEFIDIISYLDFFPFDGYNVVKETVKKIRDIATKKTPLVLTCLCRYLLNDAFFAEIIEKIKITRFFSEMISDLKPTSIFVMPFGTDDAEIFCNLGNLNETITVTTLASSITSNIRSVLHHSTKIIACYGEQAVETYRKMGYDTSRLILTGNPIYDVIKRNDTNDVKSNISQQFKIDFTKPVILVATSSFDKNEISWMEKLIEISRKKEYEVILKFHPGVEINDPEKKLKFYEKDVHLIQKIDVMNFVAISDILITDYSNVGVIASLYDKPIIVANFTGTPFPFVRYDEYGVALLATNISELELCIDEILLNKDIQKKLKESRQKYEYYFNYKNDGMAASRIFEILTHKEPQSLFKKLKRLAG